MAAESSSTDRTRELCKQLEHNRYQCSMNCYRCIHRKDKMWSCGTCFHMFHLQCIKLWASKSPLQDSSFCCPQCRERKSSTVTYTCFCGKVENPLPDPAVTPHSCGGTCGKTRGACPHPCPLQCHPGPCPPCALQKGPITCPCGASQYTYRCGTEDPKKTCGNVCGKALHCQQHTCAQTCHHGECDICMVETEIWCNCGKTSKRFLCGTAFRCDQPCRKRLSCGSHECALLCHAGPCPPCPQSPEVVKTCHCGAHPLPTPRHRCTDPIPSCGSTCAKRLSCGRHGCQQSCHPGDCPPCDQLSDGTCRCGKVHKKKMPCAEVDAFECDRVCCTPLSCQRHKCMRKCCPDHKKEMAEAHRCPALCDKIHSCGHACPLPCHRGRCPPCLETIPTFLRCRCGQTLSDPPPLACGTQPPKCDQPCALTRPCGHPSSDHSCHFGDCPPCTYLLERLCAGNHKRVQVACGTSTVLCDLGCGTPLECGHLCPRPCHDGPCREDGKPCRVPCGKARASCCHVCKRPCHAGEPCAECTQKVRLSCPCGRHLFYEKCSLARKKYDTPSITSEEDFRGVLECNDHCLFANRLEALSGLKKKVEDEEFIYLAPLYRLGLAYPEYLSTMERRFGEFVQKKEDVAALPPAPSEKRALVHLLARYYRIHSHSEDSGANRSCVISRTAYTKIPLVLLSSDIKNARRNPLQFMAQRKGWKHLQVWTDHSWKNVVNVLAPVLGFFTCDTWEEERSVCFLFTSKGRREEACSLLRQNKIEFVRGEDVKGDPSTA